MLDKIAVFLVALWLLSLITTSTLGGATHLLLPVAFILIGLNVISERRALRYQALTRSLRQPE
jgi:hypothetical protein